MRTLEPQLQRIAEQARPYPGHLLREDGTGLCLFSAAFLGWNDAIHMARLGMTVTCTDIDGPRLAEMEQIYPPSWTFLNVDAYDFALEAFAHGDMWDAVSADTFTGDQETRSLRSLSLWCSIARDVVTATCSRGTWDEQLIPVGWSDTLMHRSGTSHVDWLVLTRD